MSSCLVGKVGYTDENKLKYKITDKKGLKHE